MPATLDRSADWLRGFIADLPTPFTDDDGLDLAAFARLCERQISAGATAVLVGETAGESATLTSDERIALIRTAADLARGRLRVIAGTGSNATSRAIELTQQASDAGADAVMSVVPYYNRPTQAGLDTHFRAIAAATSLPIILHDAPGRCARALSDEVLASLADVPGVIGLRDDTSDATRLTRLRHRLPPAFRLLTGDDAHALSYLALGGDGCISIAANITPELCHGLYVAGRQQRTRDAAAIMDKLAPLNEAMPQDLAPAALKYALSLRGLATPRVRLPLVEPSAAEKRGIASALEQFRASTEDHAARRRSR